MAIRREVKTAIGVISGTSMDGIDVALIESDGEALLKTGPAATFPYPERATRSLRAVVATPGEAEAPQPALERDVTDAHVAAVEAFMTRFSMARESVALVGLHGQTILHRPRERLTRQLCDGARAAAALGVDVVSDFRSADVKAGRRRRAARADLSRGDGRCARAPAHDPQLGRRRQCHLSRRGGRDRRLRHRTGQCADRRFSGVEARARLRRKRGVWARAGASTRRRSQP